MHELILRDADGHELMRRPCPPSEKYTVYKILFEKDCIEHDNKRFRLLSGGWRLPEQDFMCCAIFEGFVYVDYCDC